jgi:SAM-dependent methyltransferase
MPGTNSGEGAMPTGLLMAATNRSPNGRRQIFRWVFDWTAKLTREVETWTFMNYGYMDLDGAGRCLDLVPWDEPERPCIQLYDHVVSGVALKGRDVVEVSCGRGGGASFISRYLRPRSLTAIDISENAVAFCRRVHRVLGLRFMQGDAEAIPLSDESADVVVNVGASCLYGDQGRFFGEVRRILRPGGLFLFADIRLREEVADLRAALEGSGLRVLQARDITENVARALEADHQRRVEGVQRYAPPLLGRAFKTFAGTRGTRIPKGLASGRMIYLSFVLAKEWAVPVARPAAAAAQECVAAA